ncbi:MAG TPA: hypothetical protein VFO19_02415, partial [Vicinamibacterales bacterium]|nr:hypothetical protein [Vicinamibacterales bacterium]
MPLRPGPLTSAFLSRLFDAESDAGAHDGQVAFIWMLAGLAAPGFILPILLMGWDWTMVERKFGLDVLQQISRADRVLYIGLSMVATGAVSALVWNRLLIDRRDTLVLGPLPVRPGAIVRAKIASLAIYVCAISAAMHTLASLTYGSLLSIEYFGVGWRGASAHFAAASAASLFTFLVVTSAQAILALTIAPPYLPRASAALQATLVATILVLLVALPSISRTVSDTLGDARAYRYMFDFRIDGGLTEADRWTARLPSSIAWLPPVWFAGLYETLLRHDNAHLAALARRAIAGVGAGLAITLIGLPIAYRRIMTRAVELPDGIGPRRRLIDAERLARVVSGPGLQAAMSQFLLAAIGRVSRQRFVVAAAVGACIAWSVPALMYELSRPSNAATGPGVESLAVPFWMLFFLAAGVRVAAALPTDVRAGWIFDVTPGSTTATRAGLRRLSWGLLVVPIAGAAAIACAWRGSGLLAGAMAATIAGAGALVTEVFLLGLDDVPCGRPWPPQRQVLRRYWTLYILSFVGVATLPAWLLARTPGGAVLFAVVL